jgi:murein DD-endopeptidase MepM/ murein hydrolase activator NlpD
MLAETTPFARLGAAREPHDWNLDGQGQPGGSDVAGPSGNPRDEIKRLSNVYGVPEHVALAVAHVQSGFDQAARYGDKTGLMGVKVSTVTHLHDPAHWRDNIRAGLQQLYSLHAESGNWSKALVAYDGESFAKHVATAARDIKSGKIVPPKGDPGVITLSRPMPAPFRPLSDFGRRGPGGAAKDFHTGVDLAAPEGTPVAALTGGKVIVAGNLKGAGLSCLIRDPSGREWVYAHMSDYSVSEGATVKAGDQLGKVGHTGDTTGNALHIGVRIRGEWQNPVAMVQRAYGVDWGKTKRSSVAVTDFYAPDYGGAEVGATAAQAPDPMSGETSVTNEWQRIANGAHSPEALQLARERGAVA